MSGHVLARPIAEPLGYQIRGWRNVIPKPKENLIDEEAKARGCEQAGCMEFLATIFGSFS